MMPHEESRRRHEAAVHDEARRRRHEDLKEEWNQDQRRVTYGSFNTAGRAGIAPVAPDFGEADPDLITEIPPDPEE